MGYSDHLPELAEEAKRIAIEAGAISPCVDHGDVMLDNGDPEANGKAYALGTIRWRKGDLQCTYEKFKDAIKDTIDSASDECQSCAKVKRA